MAKGARAQGGRQRRENRGLVSAVPPNSVSRGEVFLLPLLTVTKPAGISLRPLRNRLPITNASAPANPAADRQTTAAALISPTACEEQSSFEVNWRLPVTSLTSWVSNCCSLTPYASDAPKAPARIQAGRGSRRSDGQLGLVHVWGASSSSSSPPPS